MIFDLTHFVKIYLGFFRAKMAQKFFKITINT